MSIPNPPKHLITTMTETTRTAAAAAEIARDVMRVLEMSTGEDGFKGEVDSGLVEVKVGMDREASEKVEGEEIKSMEVKK